MQRFIRLHPPRCEIPAARSKGLLETLSRRVGGQTHRRRSTSNPRRGLTPLLLGHSHRGVQHHGFACGTTPELDNGNVTTAAMRGRRPWELQGLGASELGLLMAQGIEMDCAVEPHIGLGSGRGMRSAMGMGNARGWTSASGTWATTWRS
jgi:hypothetical protein